jgi:hypothetical protein
MVTFKQAVIFSGVGLCSCLCVLTTPTGPVALGQELTFKELARVNGGRATMRVTVNASFGSWQQVVAMSEVIVHGQIASLQPRLTKDDNNVLTYVSLAPLEFLKGTHKEAPATKPGFTSGIVFIHGGGRVVVDGLELTMIDESAPEPALKVGEQVVAFLTPMASEPGVFNLAYGSLGLLRLQGGKLINSSPQIDKVRPVDSGSVAELRAKIRGLLGNTVK